MSGGKKIKIHFPMLQEDYCAVTLYVDRSLTDISTSLIISIYIYIYIRTNYKHNYTDFSIILNSSNILLYSTIIILSS